jgi:hypothetical protein
MNKKYKNLGTKNLKAKEQLETKENYRMKADVLNRPAHY